MPWPLNTIEYDIETMAMAISMLEAKRSAVPIIEKCYRDALDRLRADLGELENCMLNAAAESKEAQIALLREWFGR